MAIAAPIEQKQYKVVNGTSYHPKTSMALIDLLENLRANSTKIIIRLGDSDTGRDWMEENDCVGRIGRSTGSIKIPLLVPAGEHGGPGLLDDCIVKIIKASNGQVLYQHHSYNRPDVSVRELKDFPGYILAGYFGDELVARFTNQKDADKWHKFMTA